MLNFVSINIFILNIIRELKLNNGLWIVFVKLVERLLFEIQLEKNSREKLCEPWTRQSSRIEFLFTDVRR